MDDKIFSIQALADRAGTTRRTIRYYVQRGLLPRPEGGGRGHYYTEEHLRRLAIIKKWRRQGVPLEKMRELLESGDPASVSSAGEVTSVEAPAPAAPQAVSTWDHVEVAPGVVMKVRRGMLSSDEMAKIVEAMRAALCAGNGAPKIDDKEPPKDKEETR